ncbi:hypothetical protein [Clostridium sp.]|nr:hypothetical protein [Clostridium sp.]
MLKRDEEVKQLEELFDNLGQTQEVNNQEEEQEEEGQDSVNLDEVFLKL